MNRWILLVFAFFTLSFVSLISNAADSTEDRMGHVMGLFDAGRLPSIEELTGYFSGRCYRQNDRNKALNFLQAGEWVEDPNNNDPLFPKPAKFKLSSFELKTGAPGYFDEPKSEDLSRVQNILINSFGSTEQYVDWHSQVVKWDSGEKLYIRANGEHFVSLLYGKNQNIFSACYTYKKIK